MKKHLTYTDEKSNKFWAIETSGNAFTVTFGKIGTAGTSQTKTWDSEEQCQKEAEKLLAEKLKKGYLVNNRINHNSENVTSKSTPAKNKTKSTFTKDEVDTIEKMALNGNVKEILAWLDQCKAEGKKWQDCKEDEYGSGLGDWAVLSESLPLMRSLLAYSDFNFEQRNKNGYRPLHVAAKMGNLEVVRFLVEEAKVKVDIKGNFEFIIRNTDTPLYTAIYNNHTDIALYLIDYSADLNILCDTSHRTAVSCATAMDNITVLKKLLERGACANGISNSKDANYIDYFIFPLMEVRSSEAVTLLLQHGANINALNKSHNNALANIIDRDLENYTTEIWIKHVAAIQALVDAGIFIQHEFLSLTQSAVIRDILRQAIIKCGEKINNGSLLWGLSKEIKAKDIPEFIIEIKNATAKDVNYISTDHNNCSIIHNVLYAARCEKNIAPYRDATLALLEKGANPNAAETLNGNNALLGAIDIIGTAEWDVYNEGEYDLEAYNKALKNIIEAIAKAGADPYYKGDDGLNSFEHLDISGHADWFNLLGKKPKVNYHLQLLKLIKEYFDDDEKYPLSEKVVSILKSNPINYQIENDWGTTLIESLLWIDNPEINQTIFLQISDQDLKNKFPNIVYQACVNGAFQFIQYGLENKKFSTTMLNTKCEGVTPLMELMRSEKNKPMELIKTLSALVEVGADMWAVDDDGDDLRAYINNKKIAKQVDGLFNKLQKH